MEKKHIYYAFTYSSTPIDETDLIQLKSAIAHFINDIIFISQAKHSAKIALLMLINHIISEHV
jgi:hypothetical protein